MELVPPSMRRPLLLALVIAALAGMVIILLELRDEVARTNSPDGRYRAVTTVSSWRQFVPMMPGQSGDWPCRVEIIREDGVSMGALSVEMVQLAAVEWVPDGAQIRLVGGWDFAKGLCWKWDRDGTSYRYIRGHAP